MLTKEITNFRMRNYRKKIETRYGIQTILNPGLKQVHIGEDVWVYGRQGYVTGKGLHMVIYGPNRKEYHVWSKDVTDLTKTEDSEHYDNWGYCNRQGNRAIQSKVKRSDFFKIYHLFESAQRQIRLNLLCNLSFSSLISILNFIILLV